MCNSSRLSASELTASSPSSSASSIALLCASACKQHQEPGGRGGRRVTWDIITRETRGPKRVQNTLLCCKTLRMPGQHRKDKRIMFNRRTYVHVTEVSPAMISICCSLRTRRTVVTLLNRKRNLRRHSCKPNPKRRSRLRIFGTGQKKAVQTGLAAAVRGSSPMTNRRRYSATRTAASGLILAPSAALSLLQCSCSSFFTTVGLIVTCG